MQLCLNNPFDGQLAVFEYIKSQLNGLIMDKGKPDSGSVQTLIRQVARYVRQHQQVDGFCGDNAACKSCAKTNVAYETNWKKYAQFYRDKLSDLSQPIDCLYYLAYYCKFHLLTKVQNTRSKRSTLYTRFQNVINSNTRPTKWQMKGMIEEYNELENTSMKETVDSLFSPNSASQSCFEHNVNCWNSNPDYSSYYSYCKTPREWRFINYTPSIIEANCTLMWS